MQPLSSRSSKRETDDSQRERWHEIPQEDYGRSDPIEDGTQTKYRRSGFVASDDGTQDGDVIASQNQRYDSIADDSPTEERGRLTPRALSSKKTRPEIEKSRFEQHCRSGTYSSEHAEQDASDDDRL